MALPAGKFLQTYICQCYPCCDEVIPHVRLEALLQSAAHQEGLEHSSKRRTEDAHFIEKLYRNWAASFSLRGNTLPMMLPVLCEWKRKAPLPSKQHSSALMAFSPYLPVDWNTPGLHLQYQLAKASIIRSIFCASPGSRKLQRNCLSGAECQTIRQIGSKGHGCLPSTHGTP